MSCRCSRVSVWKRRKVDPELKAIQMPTPATTMWDTTMPSSWWASNCLCRLAQVTHCCCQSFFYFIFFSTSKTKERSSLKSLASCSLSWSCYSFTQKVSKTKIWLNTYYWYYISAFFFWHVYLRVFGSMKSFSCVHTMKHSRRLHLPLCHTYNDYLTLNWLQTTFPLRLSASVLTSHWINVLSEEERVREAGGPT